MSFLDYSDKLPKLVAYEEIDSVISDISVRELSHLVSPNLNQIFHEGRSLLECMLETFERNNNKNIVQKLLQKITILITQGASCPRLYDPKTLVNIVTKCAGVSNRTNFQLITRLGKIFDCVNVDISPHIDVCDERVKKMWRQTFVHVRILRETRNCINHIRARDWDTFLENINLLISLFTSDYTKNDWCFHNISQELISYNWQSDESYIAAQCISSVIHMYPRMVCDIILNIDKHIGISGIIELCSKYYEPSYDSTLLYGLHNHFINNTITTLVIDISLNFITNTELILVCDPDFPVRRTLLSELQATRDNYNNELLPYLEVTLFDRRNNII